MFEICLKVITGVLNEMVLGKVVIFLRTNYNIAISSENCCLGRQLTPRRGKLNHFTKPREM